MNESIIADGDWDKWARELVNLQSTYPTIAEQCFLHDEFKDFDGTTGFDLPLCAAWAVSKAHYLIGLCKKEVKPNAES